jgi:hypothetical protein
MSRWGEMFRALSHPSDTIDTADTMVAADALPAIVSHCVNSVRGVDGGKAANQRANSGQPTVADYSSDRAASPLETLRALSRSARPQCERSEKSEINAPRNEESPLHRPDEGLNSLNSLMSPPANAYDIEERARLVESGAGVPGSWAEGFAACARCPSRPGSRRSGGGASSMPPAPSSITGPLRPPVAAGAISMCSASMPIGPMPVSTPWAWCCSSIAARSSASTRVVPT